LISSNERTVKVILLFERIKGMVYDVAIIGAGVTGCFIAKELSKYRLKVVVLEKEPTQGIGPTKGCSGIIHAFQLPFNSLKGKLCLEGNIMMDKEADELGFRFKRVGLILVSTGFFSSLILKFAKLYLSRYVEVKYLKAERIREIEPNISEKVRDGLFFPTAGVVNPVEMTFMARKFAEINGVEFLFESRVTNISREEEFYRVEIDGKNDVTARVVINCAGLYADEIANMAGQKIRITPGKGSHIVFDDRDFSHHLIAVLPLKPDKKTKGGGALVTIDGNLIWGPSLIETNDKEDRSVYSEEVKGLIEKHSRAFSRIPEKPVAVYAGVRAMAGKDFIINRNENLINVAGIQSPGLTAAPAIARMVLKMLEDIGIGLERKSDVKKYEFRIRKEGELICHCRDVFESQIRDVIREGASTLDDIKHLTNALMGCGKCLPHVMEIMEEEGLQLRKDFSGSHMVWRE
jgi:glycerol-3-phosphate dehydrogenase